MENIKTVELVFENCEVHIYDGELIDEIILDDSTEVENDYYENAHETKEFYLRLKPEANNSKYVDENFKGWSKNPFKRIVEHDDIVYVIIKDTSDNEVSHQIVWDDSDYWQTNSYQKSLIDCDGYLHIAVHERNKDL